MTAEATAGRADQADILKKWAAGQTLSEQEAGAISDLLPAEIVANPPAPRTEYRHALAYYAEQIGYAYRNIKRLVAAGRKARMVCPLDAPGLLPAWWDEMKAGGHVHQGCPQRLIDYAIKFPAVQPVECTRVHSTEAASAPAAATGTEGKPAAGEKSSTPPALPPSGTKVDFSNIQGVGLEAAVHELRIQLSANQQALRRSMESGENDVVVGKKKKHFEDTLELLSKTEQSLQRLQAARGDLAPVADFRADLNTILTTLRGMKRKLADNVCASLASALSPEQLALVREAIAKEAAREETQMRTAKHWKRAPDGSIEF